jgi:cytochrome c-type biogenesis protein CcmH
MIAFWIAAALISALFASLVMLRAARAEAAPATEDPTLAVYRRQLTEIDALAERGLLPDGEVKLARAEAGRRLLGAADQAPAAVTAPIGAADRRWVLAAAVVAPLAAIGLYMAVGSPGAPDQPYAKRIAAWRAAGLDKLDAAQAAAVLGVAEHDHPGVPVLEYALYQARLQSDQPYLAEQSLRKAIALAPNRADLWTELGQLLTAINQGSPTPQAIAAFSRAVALDPRAAPARYGLAIAKVQAGDVAGGLAALRALEADLSAADPTRRDLTAQIDQIAKTGAAPAPQEASPGSDPTQMGDQRAFIQAMVDRLAARLAAQPDDPAGWGKLIRAYAVLGDNPRRDAAQARANALFKDRPDALKAVRAAAGSAS